MKGRPNDHSLIKVCVVDDEEGVRDVLTIWIGRRRELRLDGVFANAEDVLRDIPRLRPDVVLVDVEMPGMSGIECVRQLRAILPELLILMLTVDDDSETLFCSLAAGANGYLVKEHGLKNVPAAILELRRKGTLLCSSAAAHMVEFFRRLPPRAHDCDGLTPREREILEFVAVGRGDKEIANVLHIAQETVHHHIKNILAKLHSPNRTEAAVRFTLSRVFGRR